VMRGGQLRATIGGETTTDFGRDCDVWIVQI
jgi:hypothetical protein